MSTWSSSSRITDRSLVAHISCLTSLSSIALRRLHPDHPFCSHVTSTSFLDVRYKILNVLDIYNPFTKDAEKSNSNQFLHCYFEKYELHSGFALRSSWSGSALIPSHSIGSPGAFDPFCAHVALFSCQF